MFKRRLWPKITRLPHSMPAHRLVHTGRIFTLTKIHVAKRIDKRSDRMRNAYNYSAMSQRRRLALPVELGLAFELAPTVEVDGGGGSEGADVCIAGGGIAGGAIVPTGG